MAEYVEVDVRGLSCPEPVLLAMDAMQDHPGKLIRVLGDEEMCIRDSLISQGGSVFSKEQRGNLRVQRFNDKECKNSKTYIQHQCCAVAFFDTLGFVCAKVLGNIRRNRIADGHKNQGKDIFHPHRCQMCIRDSLQSVR